MSLSTSLKRPFARRRHFATTTRFLQSFAFLCKLGFLLSKPHWDYQIKIWKKNGKDSGRSSKMTPYIVLMSIRVCLFVCFCCCCFQSINCSKTKSFSENSLIPYLITADLLNWNWWTPQQSHVHCENFMYTYRHPGGGVRIHKLDTWS